MTIVLIALAVSSFAILVVMIQKRTKNQEFIEYKSRNNIEFYSNQFSSVIQGMIDDLKLFNRESGPGTEFESNVLDYKEVLTIRCNALIDEWNTQIALMPPQSEVENLYKQYVRTLQQEVDLVSAFITRKRRLLVGSLFAYHIMIGIFFGINLQKFRGLNQTFLLTYKKNQYNAISNTNQNPITYVFP